MGEALIIMVREGLEATLIVGLVFGYLRRAGRLDLARPVWLGIALAVVGATAFGIVLHLTAQSLEGVARLRLFAVISAVAVVVLTWMVFWMRRHARDIKGNLEREVAAAIDRGTTRALVAVAFFAVLREGIEASLFLVATATGASGTSVFVGGLIGLAIAVLLGYGVYAGSHFLPMRAFFTITGVILILFAAGLCAKTVLFLQASGDLGTMNSAVFDLTRYEWLTQESQVGRFLAGLLGWDPRPSSEQVLAWLLYFVPVLTLFLFGKPRVSRPAPAASVPSPTPS